MRSDWFETNGQSALGNEQAAILNHYAAHDVLVPSDLTPWMRSNHAGETGAVFIYKAASLAFWSKAIRQMALEHGVTERHHLLVMSHLISTTEQSKLIPLWKLMGFGLGLFSSLFGYSFFCRTIQAVETFVEQHYNHQINYLISTAQSDSLLQLLLRCCEEEAHHKLDAESHLSHQCRGFWIGAWVKAVSRGSSVAVEAAKKI